MPTTTMLPACAVEGCDRPARGRTGSMLCNTHHARKWRGANISAPMRRQTQPSGTCQSCGAPCEGLTCSSVCESRWRTGRTYEPRPCAACDRTIPKSRRLDATTCSTLCTRKVGRAARYGLAIEDLRSLEHEQGRACAICGADDVLVIDHDHGTGAVRGLLCSGCNAGIGLLKDSPDVLEAAATYLRSRS